MVNLRLFYQLEATGSLKPKKAQSVKRQAPKVSFAGQSFEGIVWPEEVVIITGVVDKQKGGQRKVQLQTGTNTQVGVMQQPQKS